MILASFPWASDAPIRSVRDITKILGEICSEVTVVGSSCEEDVQRNLKVVNSRIRLHYVHTQRPFVRSALLWLCKCLCAQMHIALEIWRLRRQAELVIFYVSFPYHFPALLVTKLANLPSVEIVTRSTAKPGLAGLVETTLNKLDFMLLDRISLESWGIRKYLPIEGQEHKLTECGYRYVDTSMYSARIPFRDRPNQIGFVGRFTTEKGIMLFLDSIPLVMKELETRPSSKIRFAICGSGPLENRIREKSRQIQNELGVPVVVHGWIPEEKLPRFLNETRILVLPTIHSEGLPSTLLESMGCGVVVLTSPLGAIPDVVLDGETGYILRQNSPREISLLIARLLTDLDIEQVSLAAEEMIRGNYSFVSAVERFDRMIQSSIQQKG